MTKTADFLVEIGCEELPPKSLLALSNAFQKAFEAQLSGARLAFDDAGVTAYASPRRLALFAPKLQLQQDDEMIERLGPPSKIAFDDNNQPTRAGEAFASKCGFDAASLKSATIEVDGRLVFRGTQPGVAADTLLPGLVEAALKQLPIARRMRWGDSDVEFVRPVHWVVMLLGADIVDGTVLGVAAGNQSLGHRAHAPKPVTIKKPADYVGMLRKAHVVVDFEERQQQIKTLLTDGARALGGFPVCDPELLNELTALVEWPQALTGAFDASFLKLPREVLIATLQQHQRYVPIAVDSGDDAALTNQFVIISNLESREPETVRAGNERVVTPRLQDAQFFWEQDRQQSLFDLVGNLDNVVFQKQLGSVGDKTRRISALAKFIASEMGWPSQSVERAAALAKCDLVTHMVGEFPELQGTMGRYYAEQDQEPADVCSAIEQHYWPRFAADNVPETPTAQAIAIADKLDSIVGMFAINKIPTGSKDPFALRRQGLGVIRILLEHQLSLDLSTLIRTSIGQLPHGIDADENTISESVYEFLMARLHAYYAEESLKTSADSDAGVFAARFEAVLALRPPQPLDFYRRLLALDQFMELDAAENLAAANKRIGNILRKANGAAIQLDKSNMSEPAEKNLYDQVMTLKAQVAPMYEAHDYAGALTALAALRDPVDLFFDEIMVMAEDVDVRATRLGLLKQVQALFSQTADLSRLQS